MRRIDIINSINNIDKAFEESKIASYLLAGPNEKPDPEAAMEAYHKFSKYYDTFGDFEKQILAVFGLDGIESPKLWAKIITSEKSDAREIGRNYYRGIYF